MRLHTRTGKEPAHAASAKQQRLGSRPQSFSLYPIEHQAFLTRPLAKPFKRCLSIPEASYLHLKLKNVHSPPIFQCTAKIDPALSSFHPHIWATSGTLGSPVEMSQGRRSTGPHETSLQFCVLVSFSVVKTKLVLEGLVWKNFCLSPSLPPPIFFSSLLDGLGFSIRMTGWGVGGRGGILSILLAVEWHRKTWDKKTAIVT